VGWKSGKNRVMYAGGRGLEIGWYSNALLSCASYVEEVGGMSILIWLSWADAGAALEPHQGREPSETQQQQRSLSVLKAQDSNALSTF
jgi:hypothetical protein